MSSHPNAAIAARYYEECANDYGDPDKTRAMEGVDELLAPDFVMRYNGDRDDEAMRGIDRHKQFLIDHTRSYRGERWTVEAIVADDRTVACRWRLLARHTESGNAIDLRAADFFTLEDGRFATLHRFLDFKTLDEQRPPSA
jgi:ketosteroid isomerase-like protein